MKNLLLLLLAIFHVLAFAMPAAIAIPFLLLCIWFVWRKKQAELATMLVTLLLMFGCIEVFVRYNADAIFYREHERYALKTHYRPDIHTLLTARFGDMVAMDPSLKETLAEPHIVEFKTDGAGYRNDQDYNGEPYVILGDSFAATVGNSQENILVSQLNARLPNHFYSRGFPGAPKDYETSALLFQQSTHSKARFLWFIFEGNDLFEPNERLEGLHLPTYKDRWQNYQSLHILPFLTTRVVTLLKQNMKAGKHPATNSPVGIFKINGEKIGFLKRYIEHAANPTLELRILGTPEILERTACVFFIPEKYRVYKPWIKEGVAITEPAAGLVTLQKYFGSHHIPVVDLTPSLQKAAAEGIKQKQFVFWRDDTHWNAQGIASIAGDVEKCVKADEAISSSRSTRGSIKK